MCPDPVFAFMFPFRYMTPRLGTLCSELDSFSYKSCLIEGVFSLVGNVGACTFMI